MDLIRRGDKSAAVGDLQNRLERLGHAIDVSERGGVFGQSTENAVRAFQQERGLHVDSIVGPATWHDLVEASWKLGDRVLRLADPPMRGDDIRELQGLLNALGFPAGKHDGIFGTGTAGALRAFQREMALQEDAMAGRETAQALDRLRFFARHGATSGPRMRERLARGAAALGLTGKRIAIDPGHGGEDTGALGPSAERESELAFAIAARTTKHLDALGAISILLRGPHDRPEESERALLANESGADVVVSIHLNSHRSERASGAAAYFYESLGVASEPGEHLAELILDELVQTGRANCRAHGKTHPILRETRMPAVLVEPCFITNPEEAKLAADPLGSEMLAGAIVRAVAQYFEAE